jgi:hypothetical protein
MKNRHSERAPDKFLPTFKAMKRLILIFLVVFVCAYGGSVNAGAVQDRLIVKPRRIVLVRSAKIAKLFPHRKTATLTYPIISGLRDTAILRRIRGLLDFKNIFDYSLQEYREDSWLSEFSYTVNYNRKFLFDITFDQNGVAAYPDDHSKHFLINLKTGRVVSATDAFLSESFGPLAELVNEKLQAELKEIVSQAKQRTDLEASESQGIADAFEQMKFEPANLNDFQVGENGITFLYDAGLPHVMEAFEPEGRYFFTYSELRRYINRGGPLGQFVR